MAKPVAQDDQNFIFEQDDGSTSSLKKDSLSEPTRNRLETFLTKSAEPAQDKPLIFNPQPEAPLSSMPAETEEPAPQVNSEMAPAPKPVPQPAPVQTEPQPSVPKNTEIENIKTGFDMRSGATNKLAQSQAAQANAETAILDQKGKQQEVLEQNRIARENERGTDMVKKETDMQNSINEFVNSPESKVDPGRLWANKTGWEKATATIGVLLGGAFNKYNGGKNSGLDKLNADIDGDIAEQKRLIDSKKEKLNAKIKGVKTMYSMMKDRFGDERQAEIATKLGMVNQFENKLLSTASKYKSPQIMAAAQDAQGKILIEKNKLINEFNVASQKQQASNEINKMKAQAALNKSNADLNKSMNKDGKLSTPFGDAQTPDDAKKIKEASEIKNSFDTKLKELIALRKSKGAELFDREAVQRGKQLSKELLLAYKNMAKLGVLSSSDEDIINTVIPSDPLQWDASSLVGQAPTLNSLEKFQQDTEADFQSTLKTRLKDPSGAVVSKTTTSGPGPGSVVVVKGKRYKVADDGDSLLPL